eukprot:gene28458-24900_t
MERMLAFKSVLSAFTANLSGHNYPKAVLGGAPFRVPRSGRIRWPGGPAALLRCGD